ncbi:ketopantoate reductase family protein [Catenulispora pinisilvae]|uniref:ketopantoate reductase family protein n=1 Tax=Catenulispora pinisilvae TaxID=2705253 RepID=UPI0018915E9A|nr:2-dehydropantoate 2-reductase N-terminal domain-containing protein [Catenulispora pinisilvae]
MRYIIIGAGAVGGTIGGRLAEAGHDVVLVARGAHLEALRRDGLRLLTPEADLRLPVPAVAGPKELGELRPDDVLVLCVKSQDTAGVLNEWAPVSVAGGGTASQLLPVVCAQNGVENERTALRLFAHVYGLCVWLPSLHLEPGVVAAHCTPQSGILTVGRYPDGVDDVIKQIGHDLGESRFDAPVVDDVMRWKYGKLLSNLGNAFEAVSDLTADEELAERLVDAASEEGIQALNAAGIPFVGTAERRAVQGDRMRYAEIPGTPRGGGSSWQSLARGTGSIETDYLSGEIALIGRTHGIPTPVNELMQRLSSRFAATGRAPGSMPLAELAELVARVQESAT